MAISDAKIIEIITLTNGDTTLLTDNGVTTSRIARALIANPDVVARLKKRAAKEVTGYGKFYKNKIYDPSAALNEVESRYANADPRVSKFALEYWGEIKRRGNNTTTVGAIQQRLKDDKENVLARYNITEDEFDDTIAMFDADLNDFRKAQVKQQKAQYTAYNNKRKEMGITSRETAADDYVSTLTGIKGVTSIPKSVDEYAVAKIADFKNYAQKNGIDVAVIDRLSPQLTSIVKKKVGKNYQNYALQDLMKRQISGE